MKKPYFLISTSTGKAQVIIDRRKQKDEDTKAMRERLMKLGCTQKEISEEEKQELLKIGSWI